VRLQPAMAKITWKWKAMRPLSEAGLSLKWQLGQPLDDSSSTLPVVLFLHGRGERGDDNTSQMKHAKLFMEIAEPSLLVVPQCPRGTSWACPNATDESELTVGLKLAMRALNSVLASEEKADPLRVHITGLSMGGCGVWDAIARWPARFASAVPLAGVASNYALRELPLEPPAVWAFHGKRDKTFPADRSCQAIKAIKNLKGNRNTPILTLIDSGHAMWQDAFRRAVPWMFQRRSTGKEVLSRGFGVSHWAGEQMSTRGTKGKVIKIRFSKMNPKQMGSMARGRFEKYRVAKTLLEAQELGATHMDIRHDFRHGLLFDYI